MGELLFHVTRMDAPDEVGWVRLYGLPHEGSMCIPVDPRVVVDTVLIVTPDPGQPFAVAMEVKLEDGTVLLSRPPLYSSIQ